MKIKPPKKTRHELMDAWVRLVNALVGNHRSVIDTELTELAEGLDYLFFEVDKLIHEVEELKAKLKRRSRA